MKKIIFSLMFFIILLSFNSFAGSIPEDLLHSDEAQIFFGEVITYNPNKENPDIEIVPTEAIKGNVNVGTNQIYYNTNTIGDFKVKEGQIYLFTYFDEHNPTDIFEVTTYDTSTLELKNVEGDMWKRFEKYLNEGRYLDAEHSRIDRHNEKISVEGEDVDFIEFLGVTEENVREITILYDGNVYTPDVADFYNAIRDIKLRDIEDVVFDSNEAISNGMYISINGNEGYAYITNDCKVDKYTVYFSRLPYGAHTIKFDDFAKLKSFTVSDEEKANLPVYEQKDGRKIIIIYISLFLVGVIGIGGIVVGILKKRKIISIIGGIIILWLLLGIIDFSLVHNYKKPIFCIITESADDGGSGKYVGLGYYFDIEGNFMPEETADGITSYRGYIFGQEVSRGFLDKQIVTSYNNGNYQNIYNYVMENEKELEDVAKKFLNDLGTDMPKKVKAINVYTNEKTTIVEFAMNSFTKQYSGFYYSTNNVPAAFQNADIALNQIEDNIWEWKATGDNKGKTIKIADNWYYYEASF